MKDAVSPVTSPPPPFPCSATQSSLPGLQRGRDDAECPVISESRASAAQRSDLPDVHVPAVNALDYLSQSDPSSRKSPTHVQQFFRLDPGALADMQRAVQQGLVGRRVLATFQVSS